MGVHLNGITCTEVHKIDLQKLRELLGPGWRFPDGKPQERLPEDQDGHRAQSDHQEDFLKMTFNPPETYFYPVQ